MDSSGYTYVMGMVTEKNNINAVQKILVAAQMVKNWYYLPLDKLRVIKEITFEFKTGYKLICRGSSTDVNEAVVIASGLEYPPQYLKMSKGDIVFDLGANIGSFLVYVDWVNKKVDYTGYAFEPFDQNFSLLQRNVKLNNLGSFRLEKAAISDKDGEVSLDTDKAFDAITVSDKINKNKTKSYRLSSYCHVHGIKKIDLMKMDVEGSEYDIIRNDFDFFTQAVHRCILEYHYISNTNNRDFLLKKLAPHFSITEVYRAGRNGVMYLEKK